MENLKFSDLLSRLGEMTPGQLDCQVICITESGDMVPVRLNVGVWNDNLPFLTLASEPSYSIGKENK